MRTVERLDERGLVARLEHVDVADGDARRRVGHDTSSSSALAGPRPLGLGATDHVPVAPAVAIDHCAITNDATSNDAALRNMNATVRPPGRGAQRRAAPRGSDVRPYRGDAVAAYGRTMMRSGLVVAVALCAGSMIGAWRPVGDGAPAHAAPMVTRLPRRHRGRCRRFGGLRVLGDGNHVRVDDARASRSGRQPRCRATADVVVCPRPVRSRTRLRKPSPARRPRCAWRWAARPQPPAACGDR